MPEGPLGGPRPAAQCSQYVYIEFSNLSVDEEFFKEHEEALYQVFEDINTWMEEDVGTRPSVQDSGFFFVAHLEDINVTLEQLSKLRDRINDTIQRHNARNTELKVIQVRCD